MTRYRVMIPAGSDFSPHPTLPTFGSMTEATLESFKVAGPTRIDAEIAERSEAEKCDACRSIEDHPTPTCKVFTIDLMKRLAASLARDKEPSPLPLRCQKCGIWKDSPSRPFDDPNSICYSFTGYMGAPEPNGDHEWAA